MPRPKKAQASSLMPSSIRVEDVQPRVDCGDESVKRCVGDVVRVTATVIAHGTKVVRAAVCFKSAGATGMGPHSDARGAPTNPIGTRAPSSSASWDIGTSASRPGPIRSRSGRTSCAARGSGTGRPLRRAVRRRVDRRPVDRHRRRGAEARRSRAARTTPRRRGPTGSTSTRSSRVSGRGTSCFPARSAG